MKFSSSILLAVFVIAITLLNSGSADYGQHTCQYNCKDTCTPIVNCNDPTAIIESDSCKQECARACGFRTTGRSDKVDCKSDCNTWCSIVPPASCGLLGTLSCETQDECKKACTSTCEMNGQIYPLVEIVYGIAAGIAALMIILHGFKWLISEEPAERKEARERIIYTLYGVIIIIIAVALVNTIYSASISRCV